MHRSYPADLQAQPQKTTGLTQYRALVAASLLLSFSTFAGQSAYTWTDANGQVHFGDRPPQGSSARQVEIQVNSYASPLPASTARTAETAEIILYSTQRCGYCRQAKAFLAGHKLPFKEYDVETTSRGRADYRKLKGRGVPIILVGEQRMNGYSKEGLTALLRNAGYPL